MRLLSTRKAAEEAADRAIREGRLHPTNRESYIRGWMSLNNLAPPPKRKKA